MLESDPTNVSSAGTSALKVCWLHTTNQKEITLETGGFYTVCIDQTHHHVQMLII